MFKFKVKSHSKYKNKKIYFYGAGVFAKDILNFYDFSDFNILGFIDGNKNLEGKKINKYEIYNSSRINELKPDILILTVLEGTKLQPKLQEAFKDYPIEYLIIDEIGSIKMFKFLYKAGIFDKNVLISNLREFIGELTAKLTKKYYYEDFIRVYPGEIAFDKTGKLKQANANEIKNFKNHAKFYKFTSQFIKEKTVVDIGCGTGYGCKILKNNGAQKVFGCDLSGHALKFAKNQYGDLCEFSLQGITNLKKYKSNYFDVTICSEVLEHIKEYNKEQQAINELKRITKPGGLIIIGTPNSELLDEHGFSFDEINDLLKKSFDKYCIFENALIVNNKTQTAFEKRKEQGKIGVIISQNINLEETVIRHNESPIIKQGIEAGCYDFENYKIDTTLLHNTHSWVAIGIK